jgi:type I restriction enzyme S subunit
MEWREVSLNDLVDEGAPICYGIVLPGLNHEDGVPVVKVKNIFQGTVETQGLVKTSPEIAAQYRRSSLNGGDILLSIRGTVGRVGIVPGELTGANITQDTARIRISCRDTRDYVFQLLQSELLQKQIRNHVVGQAVKGINIRDVKRIKLPFPDKTEAQHFIAELFANANTAIEKTELLVAAKEKRFSALTHDLIHNCTERLQHFHLRDIFAPVTRKNYGNELNVLTTSAQHGLISQLDYYKKSVSADDVRGYYLLKKGEFAYNRSSSNGYPYGAIKRLEDYSQGVLSTLYLCFSIKTDAPCDSDFMAHAFEAGLLNKQLVGVCQEGARSHGLLNITKTDFFGLKISLPAVTEQRRIAAILTTARQEIDLLKKQAEAYRRQKRGLMQKLLTGAWRVKVTEEAKS